MSKSRPAANAGLNRSSDTETGHNIVPAGQLTFRSESPHSLARLDLVWIFIPSLLVIIIRLLMWHQYFDESSKADRPFIEGREAVTGMHCANDRSRWAAVVSLVHHGTWEIDDIDSLRGIHGNWGTIDKVYHVNRSGEEHFYSSKPPLYILFVASQYWILNRCFGVDMLRNPLWVIKSLVFCNQVLLFGLFLLLYVNIIRRFVRHRMVLICLGLTAGMGTFLSTFAVSLNNHLPAAVCVISTIHLLFRMEYDRNNSGWHYFAIGVTASLGVTFELPALAFLGLIGIWLLGRSPTKTLTFGVMGIAFVAAAFFGSNYWAHGSLRPPYAHRSDGQVLARLDQDDVNEVLSGKVPKSLIISDNNSAGLRPTRIENVAVEKHPTVGRWRIVDQQSKHRFALQRVGSVFEIRAWDNWYDYEVGGKASYWLPGSARGVDVGEPSRWKYLIHMTVGHHGIFSLTPIWLFSLLGIFVAWRDPDVIWRRLAYVTLTLSIVIIIFYCCRPLADRNYGGVASGFRWFFWLIPLLLLMLIPAQRIVLRSKSLTVAWGLCLAISICCGLHGFLNPWQHPWYYSP
jgi:hypothetical protein